MRSGTPSDSRNVTSAEQKLTKSELQRKWRHFHGFKDGIVCGFHTLNDRHRPQFCRATRASSQGVDSIWDTPWGIMNRIDRWRTPKPKTGPSIRRASSVEGSVHGRRPPEILQNIPKVTMTISAKSNTVETAPRAIDASTLRGWEEQHDDLLIIDVRSGAEFESLHISGSYHVPLAMLSEHTDEFAARMGPRVVLVCQSGNRAEQARKRLDSVGLSSASVLSGGVPAYAAAGGEVVRGRRTWAMERQVRMTAGSLVLASIVAGRFVSPKLRLVAGGIGAGLTFSAATNSCAMGNALSRMPWNKSSNEPTAHQALQRLQSLGARE